MAEILKNLIDEISKLPTIGRKSAEKIAFHVLESSDDEARNLIKSLIEAKKRIKRCKECANYSEGDFCKICSSNKRDKSTICIVKSPKDVLAIERSKAYSGVYHILGGKLEPLKGTEIKDLNIDPLLRRLKRGNVKEILMALDPDLEGETTVRYLSNLLKDYRVRISRIARGIPMGGNLEHSDLETISQSIKHRFRVEEK